MKYPCPQHQLLLLELYLKYSGNNLLSYNTPFDTFEWKVLTIKKETDIYSDTAILMENLLPSDQQGHFYGHEIDKAKYFSMQPFFPYLAVYTASWQQWLWPLWYNVMCKCTV